ncbi:exonuclease domain-containing protein [Luteimicrobium subarcticum]|uniref:exonuclease domain-containing protein n=1 Tax=Luteimicrobium subarcticum TaxID=620910 RepID=UPI001B80A6E6|nr:exonuclease domain-containing protein [Luteimicrobium subarcticum]
MTPAPLPLLPDDVARTYPHRYAVLDVETSGLSAANDRVLQVAVVLLSPDGAVDREWTTLLDPGCDPGRTDIHGLTRERLAGSPTFPDVAGPLTELLDGRVLVAHNARFDWDFLAHEAARAGVTLPVEQRLCTLALTRRLDLPTENLSLAALARYWGVPQQRAHDAVDDTRVLAGVLRHSLVAAHRFGLDLPLAACATPRGATRPAPAPRTPCAWRDPGRAEPGRPLRQGMKVVFTGGTVRPREVLVREATAAGLDVMNSVSSRTGLVVCNAADLGTGKAAAARRHGTLVVTEDEFIALLAHVQPGDPKAAGGAPLRPPVVADVVVDVTLDATVALDGPARAPQPAPTPGPAVVTKPPATRPPVRKPAGPLAGRRVLVVGGPHAAAGETRARIVEQGGQAAAMLTASVTHVVALEWPEEDSRWARVVRLAIPRLDPATLEPLGTGAGPAPDASPTPADDSPVENAPVLPRGGAIDLDGDAWTLGVSWTPRPGCTVDVVALVVDDDEQVGRDEDLCFFNQPEHPSGAVTLDLDAAGETLVDVRAGLLAPGRTRVLVAASMEGDTAVFGDLGPVELVLRTPTGETVVRATLDAAEKERTLALASVYRRGDSWRFRAIGQGWGIGLGDFLVTHGVDVED